VPNFLNNFGRNYLYKNSSIFMIAVKEFQKLREGTSKVLIKFLMLVLSMVEESALVDNLNGSLPP